MNFTVVTPSLPDIPIFRVLALKAQPVYPRSRLNVHVDWICKHG
jgi:hypothetical protein